MSVIVFDLDGTLVSSADDLIAALNFSLDETGYQSVPSESVAQLVGMGAKVMIQRALEFQDVEWTDAMVQPLFHRFLHYYSDHIAVNTRPFEGVEAALHSLAQDGWKLSVCTNKTEQLARKLLDQLDLTKHFSSIVGGDTFSKPKPSADPILGCIKQSAGELNGSIMVGDSRADIEGARNAGIPSIGVDFGYSPVPIADLNPNRVISHFDNLFEAVLELKHIS